MEWLIEILTPHGQGSGTIGVGFDLYVMLNIGKVLLAGDNPYAAVNQSWYPPATNVLFALVALLPGWLAFSLLTLASLGILVALKKRSAILWLLFWPVAHVIASGQIDLLLVGLIPLLRRKDRWAALGAALMFLKPQMALVILPWLGLQWLRHDRRMIAWAAGFGVAINVILPLLIRPTMFVEWISILGSAAEHKNTMAAGLWLTSAGVPPAILAVAGLVAIYAVLRLREPTARLIVTAASPLLSWYDTVILLDVAPWYVMIPMSLLGIVLARAMNSWVPLWLIWAGPLAWMVGNKIARLSMATITPEVSHGHRWAA